MKFLESIIYIYSEKSENVPLYVLSYYAFSLRGIWTKRVHENLLKLFKKGMDKND